MPEVAELDELPDLADLAGLADLGGLPDPHDLPAQAAAAQTGSGPSTLEADAPAWAHAAGGASPGLGGAAAAGAFAGEPAAEPAVELDLEPDEAEASSADAIYTSFELELPSGFDDIAPAAQPAAAAAGEEEEEAYKQIGDLRSASRCSTST